MPDADIIIRSERPDDCRAINDLIILVFHEVFGSGQEEVQLVAQLREEPGYRPDLSLVACHGQRIVGHVLFSPVVIETSSGDLPGLALAPLGVERAYRRRGIGKRLVETGLERAKALGYRAVLVQGSPKYYGRFGFQPASQLGITVPFGGVPDDENVAMTLAAHGLAGGGRARYPDPWKPFM